MSRELTAEQRAQLRTDIERRKSLPDFGPDTSIERIKIINATKQSFTPEVVEALLDELERKEKEKSELKSYYEGVIADGSRHIAELEARTVTVKLPSLKQTESGERYVWSDGVHNFKSDVIEVLRAAGVTVEG